MRALTITTCLFSYVYATALYISIEPSDPQLVELEHWGRYAAAAYDNFESWSSCLTCQQADIKDTQLLATWSTALPSFSRGFVGIHHSHKQVLVVFRGSSHVMDALSDAQAVQTPWPTANHTDETGSKVHLGFLLAYMAARPHIETALLDIRNNKSLHNYSLHFIGHSLGAAQAALAFVDFNSAIPYLTTFGAPRIGNVQFTRILQRLSLDSFQRYSRVVHEADMIVHLPLSAPFNSYTHGSGHELWVKDSEDGDKCQMLVKCRDDTEDIQCSAGVSPLRWNIFDHWVYPGMRLGLYH
ncbi:hypothetical protein H4R22_004588 [Coemansia sp. RSA 1290]|nr:hypothetical protein H4R22_004588 [Coemansia sp. RSA 1290]